MDEDKKQLKGSVLEGYQKYIKKKWGDDGLDECLKASKFDLRDLQKDRWYHYMTSIYILDWIRDAHGLRHCRLAGRAVVTEAGIITWGARILGIERVLEKGVDEYRNSLNYGDIKIVKKDKEAKVILTQVIVGDTDRETWIGVLEGILEITKKTGTVKAEHKGDVCTFTMKWK